MSSVPGRCGGVAAGTEADAAICLAAKQAELAFRWYPSTCTYSSLDPMDRILFVIYLLVPKAAVCTWQGWRTAPGQLAVSPAGGFL